MRPSWSAEPPRHDCEALLELRIIRVITERYLPDPLFGDFIVAREPDVLRENATADTPNSGSDMLEPQPNGGGTIERSGATENQPILLVSSPRSGSTWVAQILSRAKNIYWVNEPLNPNSLYSRYLIRQKKWFRYIAPDLNPREFQDFGKLTDHRWPTLGAVLKSKSAHRRAMFGLFRSRWKARLAGKRALIKDPFACYSSEHIAKEFGARVVVLLRHPAGYVSSMRQRKWYVRYDEMLEQQMLMRTHLSLYRREMSRIAETGTGDVVESLSLCWRILYESLKKFMDRNPDWIAVRYEDLCSDPRAGFAKLFQGLGIEMTDDVAELIDSTTSAENPVRTEDPMHIRRDSYAVANLWKQQLTRTECETIRRVTGDVMDRFYPEGFE